MPRETAEDRPERPSPARVHRPRDHALRGPIAAGKGQPAGTKWVEGICGDAAGYWPTKLPGTLLNCGLIHKRVTLVHPNAEGHANTAAHIERAIRIALLEH
ncbi:hypothetical protein [Streptomyces sp. NPDC056323]|uniref:hypothetical protein n=1 Tax=Streptomyces sp. NPDC056323 TaxID=3345784 RepID=UPI0035DFC4B2